MNNKIMMTSASAVALIAGGAQQAAAQDGAFPDGYTLNVQGAYGVLNNAYDDKLTGTNPPSEFEDKVGDETADRAIVGSVSLARQTAPGRDMTFGLTIGSNPDNDITSSEDFGEGIDTLTRSNDFSFAALDFEMGRTVSAEGIDLRLFYGARAVASDSSLDKVGSSNSGGEVDEFDQESGSNYLGVGPRIGAGVSTGLSEQFGVSGEVGLAVLRGTRDDEGQFDVVGSDGDSDSASALQTVTSLDAQIGLDYAVSPTSKISVGYQLQQFWNIDGASDEDTANSEPRLIHGAFVGFTTTF
ncbi:MAG: Lpg1974 family pore-forming outer membrane protein [Pseudomonadota bacterium]